MTQAEKLAEGISAMGLNVNAEAQQKLLNYVALLQKWNKVYNLTAVRDPMEMVTLHLLDSLSVLPFIQSKNLLDVGSGAGLPGIVLAICLPNLQVTTIDTVQKKTIFMRQVKGELNLSNLEVVHARVEQFKPTDKFEAIISRAFSEIGLFVNITKHLIADSGQWLAMKGLFPEQELEKSKLLPTQTHVLKVDGLEAERHLIMIENKHQ